MMMRGFWHTLSVFVLLTLLCGCVNDEEEPVWSLQPGDWCPEIEIAMNDGSTLTRPMLAGKRTLIVLFSTSCPDCQRELPIIQQAYDRLAGNTDAEIVCISRSEPAASIEEFWHSHGLTLPYSAQTDDRVYRMFATGIIPRIYIIAPDLRVAAVFAEPDIPDSDILVALMEE